MVKMKSTNNSTNFFDYLTPYMKSIPKGSIEREVIRLVLFLGYRENNISSIFKNWNLYYSKYYTPEEAIALCTDFIKNNLCLDMTFSEAMDYFKEFFSDEKQP